MPENKYGNNCLIILCAGKGSRLECDGENHKSLTDFGGMPLLQRTLRQFFDVGIANSIVVTGHAAQKVAKVALGSCSGVKTVYNEKYASDRNIFSLVKALGELPENTGAYIVEGDVLFSFQAIRGFADFVMRHGFGNVRTASGGFQPWHMGLGFKADDDLLITRAKYGAWEEHMAGWHRDLGAMYLNAESLESYRKMLAEYAAISLDTYFWTPWAEHLDMFPTLLYDVGEGGGATFNNRQELERAQNLYRQFDR